MDLVYYTGGNELDKNTEQISSEHAEKLLVSQKKYTSSPICSAIIMDNQKKAYKIIYFENRVIFISFLNDIQIWYEKKEQTTYFVDKIIIRDYQYNQKQVLIELNFRNHEFSEPNICMIHISYDKVNEYYLGYIDEHAFYRNIKFGETEIFFNDIKLNFKDYIYNCHNADKDYNII